LRYKAVCETSAAAGVLSGVQAFEEAKMRRVINLAWWAWAGLVTLTPAHAGEVLVAVAANFAGPFHQIASVFQAETGHVAKAAVGSTGQFYAQIKAGAPFEVLLAAADATPRKLEAEGMAVKGQRFTYAKGRLVLWSARAGLVDEQGAVLKQGGFAHLAVANPRLAPYGAAGMATLKALGLSEALMPKIVQGDNIAQTYQFIATGNADLGVVALSQVKQPDMPVVGSHWLVPAKLYAPILQDAILLKKGEGNPAAAAFLKFLRGDRARVVIQAYGYDI
jgi:molybdate transport system substrate-binding protein